MSKKVSDAYIPLQDAPQPDHIPRHLRGLYLVGWPHERTRLHMGHLTFVGDDLSTHIPLWDTNQPSGLHCERTHDLTQLRNGRALEATDPHKMAQFLLTCA